MADTTKEIARHVIRGHQTGKYGPVGLYVGEWDGEMWATNRYWATRAERVAPLLAKYNLSADEPGGYAVNGAVRRPAAEDRDISPQPPDIGRPFAGLTFTPGVRVRIAGFPVYTRDDYKGTLWGLYQLADGSYAQMMADEFEWLSDLGTAPLPAGFRYGETSVAFHRNDSGIPMARISAEVFEVVQSARYGKDAEDGHYQPAVEKLAPARVIAYVMGRKCD